MRAGITKYQYLHQTVTTKGYPRHPQAAPRDPWEALWNLGTKQPVLKSLVFPIQKAPAGTQKGDDASKKENHGFSEPHFWKKWTPRKSSRRVDRIILHEIAVRIFFANTHVLFRSQKAPAGTRKGDDAI